MKITKTIKLLNSEDLEIIEQQANSEGITTNELLRVIISNYASQLNRQKSSRVLQPDIDDLIIANNNMITAMNYNTVVIGETLKVFLSKYKTVLASPDSELDQLGNQLENMISKKESTLGKKFDPNEYS
ncbi:hypothetical protein KII91_00510 [Leuconostoc gelidum subsp. gelidum]|uniref:hypothetical protein n=1 Tax=Leuconostoc gelidum TaxID=1244 RepID=UPI001CC3652C|nr:hypothetical protein [Leuconostoc gelidum]MBZ5977825.1 hypothetical protein [Leuconostoc gelidum subsp. gelidum]MBZ6001854.1 hypothetical protein [Leuconostoc gelidum subsp. gelidum]